MCVCVRMMIIFCAVLIILCSSQSGAAAVGDQSETNERPRDLEQTD